MANGFQGKDGQVMPFMPDEFVDVITNRYIELFEIVTGKQFARDNSQDILNDIEEVVLKSLA